VVSVEEFAAKSMLEIVSAVSVVTLDSTHFTGLL